MRPYDAKMARHDATVRPYDVTMGRHDSTVRWQGDYATAQYDYKSPINGTRIGDNLTRLCYSTT